MGPGGARSPEDQHVTDPSNAGRPAEPSAADDLNRLTRYALWAVHARTGPAPSDARAAAAEIRTWADGLGASDVVLRGMYDVSAMRPDADVMLWLHGPSAESLQAAWRGFRRTAAGTQTRLSWSLMGTHRPAEFSADHVPSFMHGTAAMTWLCVYPFVRSYAWYLLPEAERREMLREHGMAGRVFEGVQANTVAAFALNDFEWILALEANDLHELVDLMRDLRATQARRHVRVEIPFYTGHLVDPDGLVDVLR
jgi:peroxiredoxin